MHHRRSCDCIARKQPSTSQEESCHQKSNGQERWSQTSSLNNCKNINFCSLSHPACGILLWQPKQTTDHVTKSFQSNKGFLREGKAIPSLPSPAKDVQVRVPTTEDLSPYRFSGPIQSLARETCFPRRPHPREWQFSLLNTQNREGLIIPLSLGNNYLLILLREYILSISRWLENLHTPSCFKGY